MTDMRITGLHHAQICVPEGQEQGAREFYCGVLDLAEVPKPDSLAGRGGFWLQAGDRQVHVGTEGGIDRAATKAHLAYEVDDLVAWRERLSANGITPEDGVPIPGYDRFEFRDPFGNRVEFIQRS
jgi:catechol 2,3-dioxygenase-like lactoylglutathione lyase family enzyme